MLRITHGSAFNPTLCMLYAATFDASAAPIVHPFDQMRHQRIDDRMLYALIRPKFRHKDVPLLAFQAIRSGDLAVWRWNVVVDECRERLCALCQIVQDFFDFNPASFVFRCFVDRPFTVRHTLHRGIYIADSFHIQQPFL